MSSDCGGCGGYYKEVQPSLSLSNSFLRARRVKPSHRRQNYRVERVWPPIVCDEKNGTRAPALVGKLWLVEKARLGGWPAKRAA
jgi:hypothetical protein